MRWPWQRRQQEQQRQITMAEWGSGADTNILGVDTIDTALTLIPVFAATRLLADSIASLPLQTFREVDDVRLRITDPPLIRNPSQFGTAYDWIHRAVTSLTLRGNAYGLVTVLAGNGAPAQIEWLHPDEVQLVEDRTDVRPEWWWLGRPLDSSRLVHIPGYTLPGKVLGVSPIRAYAMTIQTGLYAQMFGRDWLANGATPSAILTSDSKLVNTDAKTLKERFKAAAAAREPVVLGSGLKYDAISVPAEESQFLKTLQASKTDIATIYGIPPEKIGGETGNSLTYATVEQNSLDFVAALRPYFVRLETAISGLIAQPHYVRFNVDSMLRTDLKSRYEAHHLALTDGWKSRDEVRRLENLAPLPNGEGEKYPPLLPQQPARIPGGAQ